MSEDYWNSVAEWQAVDAYRIPPVNVLQEDPVRPGEEPAEYVHMQLHNGEAVRFKRVWSGYRFSDRDVAKLIAGMEIRITTQFTRGMIGSLEWQSYKGREYYGFSPWAHQAYNRENAPFPLTWNNHTFTEEEEAMLRVGLKVLLVCVSNRSGSTYAVHVSFKWVTGKNGEEKWGIEPHFEEFNQPPSSFTRATCPFKPVFGDKTLTQAEIAHVRAGGELPYSGISKAGRPYNCYLALELDTSRGERWGLIPRFK